MTILGIARARWWPDLLLARRTAPLETGLLAPFLGQHHRAPGSQRNVDQKGYRSDRLATCAYPPLTDQRDEQVTPEVPVDGVVPKRRAPRSVRPLGDTGHRSKRVGLCDTVRTAAR
jgi:hypothetical protein